MIARPLRTLTRTAFGAVAVAALLASAPLSAEARDQIRIVGSSTVFPFATVVAENLGKSSAFKTPIVESTGSGGGIKLFCSGVGVAFPDIVNSSRLMKSSEFESCRKNGVSSITQVRIGFDGIVIAHARSAAPSDFTKKQIFLALAKEVPVNGAWVANPNAKWSDVDPTLPGTPIEVLGPPPTSGTRDAFVELVMEPGCLSLPECKALKESDPDAFKARFGSLREDGRFIEAGENDNLIVQKLQANPNAFGIFGYSFLDQNADKVQGARVDGEEPTFENISSGAYGVSRSIFFYVKNAHVGVIPGLKEYVAAFTSDAAWGPDGYLASKGLIPLPDAQRKTEGEQARALTPMGAPAN